MFPFKDYRIKEISSGSKIIGFLKNLDKNILLYFYNSRTYKLFVFLNNSFKNIILKNVTESLFIKTARSMIKGIELKDIGWFIVLVVLFNTMAMAVLRKEIDIFSVSARIFFFCLGIFLVWRGQVSSRH